MAYRFAADLVRREVRNKSRVDPYDVSPISLAPRLLLPCRIIAAIDDDYISPKHGEEFVSSWGGACSMSIFPGGHFGLRPVEVVMSTAPFLRSALSSSSKEGQVIMEEID